MRKLVLAALPALMLGACGGESSPTANETAAAPVPAAFPVGEWEVNSTVERIASSDGSTPAGSAKQGDKATRKACVADADQLSKLFADEGADCKVTTTYARQGRINTAYQCKRPGGLTTPTVNGRYTADTLDVTVATARRLRGRGAATMRTTVPGTRLGDC